MSDPVGKLKFLLDSNLGLTITQGPWPEFCRQNGIQTEESTDLVLIDHAMDRHEFDIGFVPIADFLRLIGRGDHHYRGLALATSKFTGQTALPSVLVVRADDPATGFADLSGANYGYINKSCSSSYFAAAVVLHQAGQRLDEFLEIVPVPAWQGQVDAVIAGQVRATMVPEDVWRTNPANATQTKVIGRYENARAAVVIVRQTLDLETTPKLLDALVAWMPHWEAVYGAFRPYYFADVQSFFHDLMQLPGDL